MDWYPAPAVPAKKIDEYQVKVPLLVSNSLAYLKQLTRYADILMDVTYFRSTFVICIYFTLI